MPNPETRAPARDRLFALIASIPGSGTVDWCGPARALLDEITAMSAPPPAPQAADRATVSATLWAVAEHHTIAEWICCDPINPGHDLCVQGGMALRMLRALLVDDPDAAGPAPLLDAVLAVLPDPTDRAVLERVRALHEPIEGDGGPYCQTCTQEERQPLPVGWWMPFPCPTVQVVDEELRRLAAEAPTTTKPETVSPAYARLQAAAKEATEAAHLHAMRGMRAVYQLCRQYGFGDELIPASEVLAALGLDENANTVEPAAGVRQDGAQPQEVVHACPPDGSGLTPCCGHTPFELPRTDRISSEPAAVTCAPAAVAQPGKEAQT